MKLYVDAEVDKSEKFQNTDLQGYINHHHDMIVETSVQETRQWVENDVNKNLQSKYSYPLLYILNYIHLLLLLIRWMYNVWESISHASQQAEMD